MIRSVAARAGKTETIPDSLRAVATYYSHGDMSLRDGLNAVRVQLDAADSKDEYLSELFEDVEDELSSKTGSREEFDYETKLTFPVEITMGRLETQNSQQGSEEFSRLLMGLLVEGDMRDAVKDEEYGDFETDAEMPAETIAETAQQTVLDELQQDLSEYPEGVRDAYEEAVEQSMNHQEEDREFRKLFRDAREQPDQAEQILEPYRDVDTESRFSIDWNDTELPFFGSQYERVGVLYDGMFEMYDEAGFEIDDNFRRSMILSTIGAQIWLDDVDDLEDDWREGQLTPVTATMLHQRDSDAAHREINQMKSSYLDEARRYAERSESDLAGIAIDYIDIRGEGYDLKEDLERLESEI